MWTGLVFDTYTGRSAKIEGDLALLEEAILLVKLDQLEGGTGTITLLLGKLIPLVQTALAVFLLNRHGVGALSRGDGRLVLLSKTTW